ncbi:CHAT domain protein, partial [Rhizoctonia solani AG-3 Rhs1AP]
MTVSVASAHATPEGIKKEMQNAHIVHFACHGTQDLANPLRSRLEFSKSSKIEVEELMSEPMPNARLAVLLACETAQGDQQLTEESLHLAGTMLFAGFYGAVGTLWKMEDQDGPLVCEEFYKGLLEGDEEVVQYSRLARLFIELFPTKQLQFRRESARSIGMPEAMASTVAPPHGDVPTYEEATLTTTSYTNEVAGSECAFKGRTEDMS